MNQASNTPATHERTRPRKTGKDFKRLKTSRNTDTRLRLYVREAAPSLAAICR